MLLSPLSIIGGLKGGYSNIAMSVADMATPRFSLAPMLVPRGNPLSVNVREGSPGVTTLPAENRGAKLRHARRREHEASLLE